MMFTRMIPFIILGIVALLILALFLWRLQRDKDIAREERLAAERRWDGTCQFDNPRTGAKCQREEFHLENHYREVTDAHLETW